MQLINDLPGFDVSRFKQDCPVPDCDGHLVLDHATIHDPPVDSGRAMTILMRCLEAGCGRAPRYEPMVTADEEEHLRELWGEVSTEDAPERFYPWSAEHTADRERAASEVYTDDEWARLEERLEANGYW